MAAHGRPGPPRATTLLLVHDLDVRVVKAITGELLRELTIDTSKDYRPRILQMS